MHGGPSPTTDLTMEVGEVVRVLAGGIGSDVDYMGHPYLLEVSRV